MSDQPSRIIPNTFQCPNALIDDDVMALLTGNEMKCYMVVVRKTYGWHKSADRIAKTQIMALAGLGETAVDASMTALVDLGLVLRLAENNPTTNQGILWGLQTDDDKVNWATLRDRRAALDAKKSRLMEHVRAARVGGVDHQPQVDEQPQGGVDGQGGGGVGHQGTQKPLSKAIKKEEEEIFDFSPVLERALTEAGIFRSCWPDVAERLAGGWTDADILALLAWMDHAGGKPGRFVARVRDGTKAPGKYYPPPATSADDSADDEPIPRTEDAGPKWAIALLAALKPGCPRAYYHELEQAQISLVDDLVRIGLREGIPDVFQDRFGKTVENILLGAFSRPVRVKFVSAETEPA